MTHLPNEQKQSLRTQILETLVATDAYRYVGEVVQQEIQDGVVGIAIIIGGRIQFLGVSFDAAILTAEQGDWYPINDNGTVPIDTVNWIEQRSLLGERWMEFEVPLYCEERFRRIHLMHEWVELTFPNDEVLNQPVPSLLDQLDLQQLEDPLDADVQAEISENNEFDYFRRRLWRIEGWNGLWMMHQDAVTLHQVTICQDDQQQELLLRSIQQRSRKEATGLHRETFAIVGFDEFDSEEMELVELQILDGQKTILEFKRDDNFQWTIKRLNIG